MLSSVFKKLGGRGSQTGHAAGASKKEKAEEGSVSYSVQVPSHDMQGAEYSQSLSQLLSEWSPDNPDQVIDVQDIESVFEFVKRLGGGVSGAVFEVVDRHTGTRYALKKISRADKWSKLLFTTESKFLAKISHRGIVRILGRFRDEKHYYIVVELGKMDLFRYVKKSGRVPESMAREIVREVLTTASFLHSRNVVHRDIKPENVVLFQEHRRGRKRVHTKMIDLADALVIRDDDTYREFVGTLCYLAPERLREHRGWQLKSSDIFAIGVLAYEIITGKRCFFGSDQDELVQKLQYGVWRFPESFQPSKLCQHFIQMLLTTRADQRPTAEHCLKHPWLTDELGKRDVETFVAEAATSVPRWATYHPEAQKT